MKNILVIGGSGFVGAALCRKLHRNTQLNVYAPTSKVLNACSYADIAAFIKLHNIQILCHAAAKHAGIGTGINNALYFLESNLLMNYNLVKAAYENGVKKFITFGTSCCYNDESKTLMDESDYWKNRSENTYGTCKRIMLEHLENQSEMKWVYLIPPNLYGPGDHFGEKNTHFIPATFKKFDDAVATSTNEITVWGDGTQERDFLYIDDLVEIVTEAVEKDTFDNKPVNVSAKQSTSVKKIVLLIQKYMGFEQVKINWDTTKPTGVHKKELDNTYFLSMKPHFSFTDIEKGIASIAAWHKNGDKF